MYSSIGAGGNANSWGAPNYSRAAVNTSGHRSNYSRVSAFEMDDAWGSYGASTRGRASNLLGDKFAWKRAAMMAFGAVVFLVLIFGGTGDKNEYRPESYADYNTHNDDYNPNFVDYSDTTTTTSSSSTTISPGLRGDNNNNNNLNDNHHQEGHDAYFHHDSNNFHNNNDNQDINDPYAIYGKESYEQPKQPFFDKTQDELPEQPQEQEQEEQQEQEQEQEQQQPTPEEIQDCFANPPLELLQICEGDQDQDCLHKGCMHGVSHAAQHFIDQRECRENPPKELYDLCSFDTNDEHPNKTCIEIGCSEGIDFAKAQFGQLAPKITQEQLDACTDNPTPEMLSACENKQNLNNKYYYSFPWYHSCLQIACTDGPEQAELYANGDRGCDPRVPFFLNTLCASLRIKDKDLCIKEACLNGSEAARQFVLNHPAAIESTTTNANANNNNNNNNSTDSIIMPPLDAFGELCLSHPLSEVKLICDAALNTEDCLKEGCKGPEAARLYVEQQGDQSGATDAEIAEGLNADSTGISETTESKQVYDPNTAQNETLTITRASPSSSTDESGQDDDDTSWPSSNGCEAAFAYDPISATCFTEYNMQNWGWSTCFLSGTYSLEIYTGALHCDTTKGTKVGDFDFYWDEKGSGYASYTADYSYGFKQIHFNIGPDPLPKDDQGHNMISPQFYSVVHNVLQNPKSDHITFADLTPNAENKLCIIAHALVCTGDEYDQIDTTDYDSTATEMETEEGAEEEEEEEEDSEGAGGPPSAAIVSDNVVICHGTSDDENPFQKIILPPSQVTVHLTGPHNEGKKYHDGYPGERVEVDGMVYTLSEDCELISEGGKETEENGSFFIDAPSSNGVEVPANPDGEDGPTPPIEDLLLMPPNLAVGEAVEQPAAPPDVEDDVEPETTEEEAEGDGYNDEYNGEDGTEPNMLGDTGYDPTEGSQESAAEDLELKTATDDEIEAMNGKAINGDDENGENDDVEQADDLVVDDEIMEELWEDLEGEDYEGEGDEDYDSDLGDFDTGDGETDDWPDEDIEADDDYDGEGDDDYYRTHPEDDDTS